MCSPESRPKCSASCFLSLCKGQAHGRVKSQLWKIYCFHGRHEMDPSPQQIYVGLLSASRSSEMSTSHKRLLNRTQNPGNEGINRNEGGDYPIYLGRGFSFSCVNLFLLYWRNISKHQMMLKFRTHKGLFWPGCKEQ